MGQATIVQANYEKLEAIAQKFGDQEQLTAHLRDRIAQQVDALRGGAWVGAGAESLLQEMDSEVLPACQRLSAALGEASAVTLRIRDVLRAAEEEAAALFVGGDMPTDGGKGFWGHVSDFFSGMWAEGADMVTGLVAIVRDPVGAAKGLWYGITHPRELWEAIKAPYVEDWNNGRPWRAIGRGTMAIVTTVFGAKGADRAAAAAKAGRATRISADAAEIGARLGNPVRAAEELATVSRGSRAEAALSRYIADESTHIVGAGDRVVLGAFRANPTRGYLGYIEEATTNGGRYYSTPDGVWERLHPRTPKVNTTYRGELVNREFLRSQFEAGVPRIELHGESIAEVLADQFRKESYTAVEIRELQRTAYQYGYTQQGNAWLLTGEWRASHLGKVGGAGLGQGSGIVSDVVDMPELGEEYDQ